MPPLTGRHQLSGITPIGGPLLFSHPCGTESLLNENTSHGITLVSASRAFVGKIQEGIVMMESSRFVCAAGAVAGMLVLAACGGTSSNLTAPAVDSKLHKAFAKVSSSQSSVSGQVAEYSPKFASFEEKGVITQSSFEYPANSGNTGETVSTDFDGKELTFNVIREHLDPNAVLTVDTKIEEVRKAASIGTLKDFDAHRVKKINDSESDLSLVTVDFHWNSGDSSNTDYFAAGYWADFDGFSSGTGFKDGEVGAFVIGKEYSTTTPNLPTTGTADFKGRSVGYYGYQFEQDGVSYNQVGEYSAYAKLEADFNSGEKTISGCIGCKTDGKYNGIWVTGVETDGSGAQRAFNSTKLSYSVTLKPVDYNDDGTFTGTDSYLEISSVYGDVVTLDTAGKWGGKFSGTKAADEKSPRAVAGTIGMSWTEDLHNAGEGKGQLSGAWYGFKVKEQPAKAQ